MEEHKSAATFKNQPLTLIGHTIHVGEAAPDFEAVDNSMNTVKFSKWKGKTCVICSVPSIDTPVCDMEVKRFNEAADHFGKGLAVLTVSMDLPFAQQRWCGAAGVHSVVTLSDYREANFGRAYGVLIKEWHLLSRAVFIVDREGIVRYTEYVKEVSNHPDYQAVLEELGRIMNWR